MNLSKVILENLKSSSIPDEIKHEIESVIEQSLEVGHYINPEEDRSFKEDLDTLGIGYNIVDAIKYYYSIYDDLRDKFNTNN